VSSAVVQQAIDDARQCGAALLKFISSNDVGLTGGHQYGFYLPKSAWTLFAPFGPEKGRLDKADVEITWQDGLVTQSAVTWYGQGTRSEYRLTRFGRGFPWLSHDLVGSLLVLIPKTLTEFSAYILETDEEIEDVQAGLDVNVVERWALYLADRNLEETADECVRRLFETYTNSVIEFPDTRAISTTSRDVVFECLNAMAGRDADEKLLHFVRNELILFKMIERKIFEPDVQRAFATLDDFVETALRILNARKSRAGRALENHLEFLLTESGLPFEMRANVDGTKPDVLLPSQKAYEEAARGKYPREKLIMVGVKTTCKDRWRQVLSEAPLIEKKHVLTLQEGISPKQLDEMHRSRVVLVVPRALHSRYPAEHSVELIDIEAFLSSARTILS